VILAEAASTAGTVESVEGRLARARCDLHSSSHEGVRGLGTLWIFHGSTRKSSCRVVMELLLQHADDVLMSTPLKIHQM